MISNMVKDIVSGTSPDTCSKDTSMSWDREIRDEEPRERPLTRSIARTSSFTTPSPVPSSENQTGQEDQPLRFVTNYCGSSKPPVPMSPTRITSSGKRRGYNNYLRKTIAGELHSGTRFQRYSHHCPTLWTHEPVHAVDCRCIATSWTPGSPQEERWRDV